MHMTFNDVEIDSDQYFEVALSLNQLKNDVWLYFNISFEKMRWYHVVNYLENTGKVIFSYQNLPKNFNGKTKKVGNKIFTMLNTNDENNDGRKHFTAMHEVTHGVLHLDGPVKDETFYSNNITETSQDLKEIQADIGASELLIPSEGLFDACINKLSFDQMCNSFECSYGALNTRLLNYLVFERNLTMPLALELVIDFRYHMKKDLCWFIEYGESINANYQSFICDAYSEYSSNFDGFQEYLKSYFLEFSQNTSLRTQYISYRQYTDEINNYF